MRFLVIEDNELWGEKLCTNLKQSFGPNTKVCWVTTQEQARELLSQDAYFSAILVDYMVPEKEGGTIESTFELAEEIRKSFKGQMLAISDYPMGNEALKLAGCTAASTKGEAAKTMAELLSSKS